MQHKKQSGLVFYSIGIVIKTKLLTSNIIQVTPIEELHMADGPLAEQVYNYKTTLPNAQGVNITDTLKGDNIIQAEWYPNGDANRTTSPDVVMNESVKIYRYADTDKYYWTTMLSEPSIRRLETVRHSYGNLPDGLKAWDDSSSYWHEVSTHKQLIQLNTTRSNGEKYAYNISVNPGSGNITIKDDSGNSVIMDSSKGTIDATAVTKLTVEAPIVDVTGKTEVNITAATINIIATSVINIEAPIVNISGKVNVSGNLSITGSTTLNGDMTASGSITASNFIGLMNGQ